MTPTVPWQVISSDLVGPLPRTPRGQTQILVVTDSSSKYVLLFSLRTATAKAITERLEQEVFLVYGASQYLICDNGVQMRSNQFQSLCDKYKTTISYTPLYYSRADPTERVNRVVKTMIATYVIDKHRCWNEYLAAVACAIRSARHGFSPYYINFGREHIICGKDHENKIIDRPMEGVNLELEVTETKVFKNYLVTFTKN